MKAKLLNEQMGVPAGTEMEVVNDGGTRARVCIAPNGLRIAVAAENLEILPDTEPLSDPLPDPNDPSLLVNIFGVGSQPVEETSETESVEETYDFSQDPEPTEDEEPLVESVFPSDTVGGKALHEEPIYPPVVTDEDLDEELPTPQGGCDGETCESCQ